MNKAADRQRGTFLFIPLLSSACPFHPAANKVIKRTGEDFRILHEIKAVNSSLGPGDTCSYWLASDVNWNVKQIMVVCRKWAKVASWVQGLLGLVGTFARSCRCYPTGVPTVPPSGTESSLKKFQNASLDLLIEPSHNDGEGTFVITARLIMENDALPSLNFSWTCPQHSIEAPACAFDPSPVILGKLQGESRGVHMGVSCAPRVSAARTKHIVAISAATVPCKKCLICVTCHWCISVDVRQGHWSISMARCWWGLSRGSWSWVGHRFLLKNSVVWKAKLAITHLTEPHFSLHRLLF